MRCQLLMLLRLASSRWPLALLRDLGSSEEARDALLFQLNTQTAAAGAVPERDTDGMRIGSAPRRGDSQGGNRCPWKLSDQYSVPVAAGFCRGAPSTASMKALPTSVGDAGSGWRYAQGIDPLELRIPRAVNREGVKFATASPATARPRAQVGLSQLWLTDRLMCRGLVGSLLRLGMASPSIRSTLPPTPSPSSAHSMRSSLRSDRSRETPAQRTYEALSARATTPPWSERLRP